MENLYQLEIIWILLIQALGDWLADPLKLVTMLGNEEFYLLLMPILYWSVDSVFGLRMGMMLLLSNGLNSMLKLAFHAPRPYWLDRQVHAGVVETSFGAPSGHAQNAASMWGLMAYILGGTWTRISLVVIIFMIGFSRIYLGVHFISDVVLGWLIGGLLLLVYIQVERRIIPWLQKQSLSRMLWLALASSVSIALLILLTAAVLGDWSVPTSWQENALAAFPEDPIGPLSLSGAFTVAGTWLGMLAGAAWLYHRRGWYNASGPLVQRVLRFLVGIVGVAILWYGLGEVFPRNEEVLSYALRYLRYTLLGLWISAAAPLLFERIGLCGQWKQPERLEARRRYL